MDNLKEILTAKNVKVVDNKISIRDYYKYIDTTLSYSAKKYFAQQNRDLTVVNTDNKRGYISIINFCKLIKKSSSLMTVNFYTHYNEMIDQIIQIQYDMYCVADLVDKRFVYKGIKIDFIEEYSKFWFNVSDICKITNAKILIQFLDEEHKHMSQNNLYIDYIGLKYIDYDDKSDRNAVSWIYQNILPLFTDAWQFTPECIKNIDLNAYKDKYCVYLIKIRHNTYKYGDSYLVRKRLHAHKSNIGSFEYVKIYTFDDFNDMKKMAKSIKQYTINNNIAYRDIHDRVELFKTDNISSIMEDIDLLYKTHYKNRDALPQSKLYYETLVNLNKLKDTETAHKLVTYPELYPDPTLIKLNEICIIKIQENEKKEK